MASHGRIRIFAFSKLNAYDRINALATCNKKCIVNCSLGKKYLKVVFHPIKCQILRLIDSNRIDNDSN